MKKIILLTAVLLLSSAVVSAQKADGGKKCKEWHKEMQDFKYKFLIQEIGLEEDKQKMFVELYSKMEAEERAIGKEARSVSKKINDKGTATNEEYAAAAETLAETKLKEGQLEKRYFDKFKTFLTDKQLYLLKAAERKFNKKLMKMHGKKDRKVEKK